ncbi:MAG: plasmid pRiA4b ORF-3 family protein [Aggregatilineales bacterium]
MPGVEIYQLRWYLKGISPLIWRRVLLRSDSTLADLHYIIQIAMNWSNYYLHRFIIYGKHFAVLRRGVAEAYSADDVRLDELGLRLNGRFLYEYSFFEWWAHDIRLEKKLPIRANKTYPVCIGAGRAAPPEDCGGADGFMERQDHFSETNIVFRLLEIRDQIHSGEGPDDEDLGAEVRQFHYWLTAKHCDRASINERLKWYACDDERWCEGFEVL